MRLTLILMRHAKSDHPGGVADHERGLTPRGREGAAKIGRWLAAEGHAPDAVLCSTAARTRATWDEVRAAAGWAVEARDMRRLYGAAPSMIRESVAEAAEACVMVIAHNPGIGQAATALALAPPEHARFADFPPAAAAVLRFDALGWAEAMRARGEVAGFAVPGDL